MASSRIICFAHIFCRFVSFNIFHRYYIIVFQNQITMRRIRLLNLYIYLFMFLYIVTLILVPQDASATKRCQDILYNTRCSLNDCRKKCWKKHHTISHQFIPNNPSQTIYACYCFFDCSDQKN